MRRWPFFRSSPPCILQGPGLQDDIARRVQDNLTKAGAGWAKAGVQGRDVQLAGDSPSAEQVDAAIAAVVGTYGVRRVESAVRVVEPPPPPRSSHHSPAYGARFVIGGTWPEGNGNTLTAGLRRQDLDHSARTASLLPMASGNWTLKPDLVPEPGTYDVTATVTSASGLVSNDVSKDEITVAPPPELKAPTVDFAGDGFGNTGLHGTWDPAVATTLAVTIGQTSYKLGADAAIAAEGSAWTLTVPAAAGRWLI